MYCFILDDVYIGLKKDQVVQKVSIMVLVYLTAREILTDYAVSAYKFDQLYYQFPANYISLLTINDGTWMCMYSTYVSVLSKPKQILIHTLHISMCQFVLYA